MGRRQVTRPDPLRVELLPNGYVRVEHRPSRLVRLWTVGTVGIRLHSGNGRPSHDEIQRVSDTFRTAGLIG